MHIAASNAIIFVRTGAIEKKSGRRRNRIRCRSALPDSPPRRHSGRGSWRCVSPSLRLSEKAARTSPQSKTTLDFAEIGILASTTPATSLLSPSHPLSSGTGRENREDNCLCMCLWDMGLTLYRTRARTQVYCQGMLVNALTREIPIPTRVSPKNSIYKKNQKIFSQKKR